MHIQTLRTALVSIIALAAILVSASLVEAQVADRVEFVNALPGSSLSVKVDGAVVDPSVSYGERLVLEINAASLGVWEAIDTATNEVLDADDGFLPESGSWMLVAHETPDGAPLVSYIPNRVDVVGEDSGRVVVYHLAGGSDHFIVGLDGRTITPDGGLSPGELVAVTVRAESHEMAIINREQNLTLSPPTLLDMETQTVTNVFITMVDGAIDVVAATAPVIPSGPGALGYCNGQPVTVSLELGETPTDDDDVILGTDGDDEILAGAGDDIICGRGGDDQIWGQDGNDYIDGAAGQDKLRGGQGNDELFGGYGRDDLNGGGGNDVVRGGPGNDVSVRGGTGDDFVDGGLGDDVLVNGNGGYDVVMGGDGNDGAVLGGPRPDQVFGGAGDDVLKGLGGADMLFGGSGRDEIRGGKQPDFLDGGIGDDTCIGGVQTDRARCETVDDSVESAVPDAIDSASLREVPCEGPSAVDGATCYFVTVPEDVTDPANGRTVELYTVYVDNGNPNGRGPVLRLSGDAGGHDGALSVATFAGGNTDALAIDLRGTGRSIPSLDCAEVSGTFYAIKPMTYRAGQLAIQRAETACLERLEGQGINVGAFTTAARVHDIEIVRELLGIDHLNLWADNYGTRLSAALLRENPEPYRAVMFSNVVPMGVSQLGETEDNVDAALARLFAQCDDDSACRAQYGDLSNRLDGILAWLDIAPQSITLTDLDGEQFEVLVDRDKFVYDYLATMLNTDATIAMIPSVIDAAWAGDVFGLATQIESVPPQDTLAVSEGASLAVTCNDEAWAVATHDRCQGWVDGTGIVSDSSTVSWPQATAIVSGDLDPLTPARWASDTAKVLPDVALAEFAGSGRRVSGECSETILTTLFTNYPVLPDVSCSAQTTVDFGLAPLVQVAALRPGELDLDAELPDDRVAAIVEGFGHETN